jgi:hypothetical protein
MRSWRFADRPHDRGALLGRNFSALPCLVWVAGLRLLAQPSESAHSVVHLLGYRVLVRPPQAAHLDSSAVAIPRPETTVADPDGPRPTRNSPTSASIGTTEAEHLHPIYSVQVRVTGCEVVRHPIESDSVRSSAPGYEQSKLRVPFGRRHSAPALGNWPKGLAISTVGDKSHSSWSTCDTHH